MENIPDMHGKIVLITGGTNGIGRVTAETLAKAGANVTVIGRDPQKTESTAKEIQSITGSAQVDYLIADLSVQADVRRAAAEFRQRHDRLNVLINNAGAVFMRHLISKEGIEMTFALNHLAYFMLTNLLLDLLIAGAPSRIINVSSAAHTGAKLDLANIASPRAFSAWSAYSQSKLANLYFTYELARRLEGTGVTVNALHPGFVATNFGRSNGGIFSPLFRLFQFAAITPEQGAQTSIYLASSPDVEEVTGKYFDKSRPVSSSGVSYDPEMARRLWDLSAQLTGMPESAQLGIQKA